MSDLFYEDKDTDMKDAPAPAVVAEPPAIVEEIVLPAAVVAEPPKPTTEEKPMSDEDFARMLQEQLYAEAYGSDSKIDATAMQKQLEEKAKAQKADEELAKKLQEQMFSGYSKPSYPAPSSYSAALPYPSYAPAHPPAFHKPPAPAGPAVSSPAKPEDKDVSVEVDMDDLLGESSEEEDEREDEVSCLICKATPKQYVVLPMCEQPHPYCVPCATKMLNEGVAPADGRGGMPFASRGGRPRGKTDGKSIQCAFCSKISTLEGGINSAKRKLGKEVDYTDGNCPIHSKMLVYFCADCLEPMCFLCQKGEHAGCSYDSLDSSFDKAKTQITERIVELKKKKRDLTKFETDVVAKKLTVEEKFKAKQAEVKKDFEDLYALLKEKEKEMSDALERMRESKEHQLENEAKWAKTKADIVDKSLEKADEIIKLDSPLAMFSKISASFNVLTEASAVPNKAADANLGEFPPLPTQVLVRALKHIKYKDIPAGKYGAVPYGMPFEF